MNKKIRFLIVTFLLIDLLMISCSRIHTLTVENPTSETTERPKPTMIIKITKEEPTVISLTPTSRDTTITSVIPPTGYSGLTDGDYILYMTQDSLKAISLTDLSQILLLNSSNGWLYLSEDKRQLVLVPTNKKIPKILNLETMVQEELPFLKGCYEVFLPKGDENFLVSCWKDEQNDELYVFSRDGKQKVQLTDCGADFNCHLAQYSPDGKWISFQLVPNGAIQSPRIGFYITPSNCIEKPYECEDKSRGPFITGVEYYWSPNSKYLASDWDKGQIRLFEFKDQKITKLRDLQIAPHNYIEGFTWSPDSSQLAYTDGNSIWLNDVANGENKFIKSFDQYIYSLIGWVAIKGGKVFQNMP